jgi:DHA1 family tetracycline resistance protein-like MFS transporter
MRAALMLFSCSLAGFLIPSTSPAVFTIWRVMEGIATGLAYPAAFAAVLTDAGTHGGKRMGTVAALGTSGLLLGPALGGLLGQEQPRLPVAVALAASLLVTLLAWLWRPSATTVAQPKTLQGELSSLKELATNLAFVGTMLPITFNKLTYSALQGILPLVAATQLHLDTRGVTAVFALTGMGFGAAQVLGGTLSDRISPRKLVLVCTPPLLAGLLVMAFLDGLVPFSSGYSAYVLCSSVIFTATLKHAATHADPARYGGMYGLLGTLTDTATVVGPLLFVNLYGWHQGLVFLDMALVGLLFCGGFIVLGRRRSQ